MKTIKNIFMVIATMSFLTSCVNDGFETPIQNEVCIAPKYTNEVDVILPVAKTKEVSDMYLIATNPAVVNNISNAPTYIKNTVVTPPATPREIPEFIEAYVISSDEGGNFYKNMYFQPLDNTTKGFCLSIDAGNMNSKGFYPGRKVFLKINGLAYCNPTSFAGGLTFGAKPTDIYWVDRLQAPKYQDHLIASCDAVSEDAIVTPNLTIAEVTAANNQYLNRLVEINDVQFKTECATYSLQHQDTSLKIATSVSSTQTLDVRTSKYANFAGNQVPSGNGKIRGVLTKYGTTYQLIIRTERDVKFTKPRVGVVAVSTPPKVGASANVFNTSINEDFSSYTAPSNDFTLPKYINRVEVGSKYWDLKSYGSGSTLNKYIQASAFNNGCLKNHFVIPVNFDGRKRMSFKTLDGYNNGIPLKVYYSTNYTPSMNMSNATLIDITSNFKLADGRGGLNNTPDTLNGYALDFTPSGLYTFPDSLEGNGYIIFEYDGTDGTTTTYQLDDILIF